MQLRRLRNPMIGLLKARDPGMPAVWLSPNPKASVPGMLIVPLCKVVASIKGCWCEVL